MAENNGSTQAKKTLLDMNASWALLVVYLAYLIGIFFVQRYFASTLTGLNGYAYIFVSMLVGVLVTFLVYNFGKILFARIAGYRIIHMRLIGVVAERRETKLAFRFDPAALLDIGLDFAPVDDNLDRNPTLIFIGGFVLEAVGPVVDAPEQAENQVYRQPGAGRSQESAVSPAAPAASGPDYGDHAP